MDEYNKIMFETLESYFEHVKKCIKNSKYDEEVKSDLQSMILIIEEWLKDEQ